MKLNAKEFHELWRMANSESEDDRNLAFELYKNNWKDLNELQRNQLMNQFEYWRIKKAKPYGF